MLQVADSRPSDVALWVSITQYAEIHSVSRPTVYKWLDAGLLESYRVGGVIRIRTSPPAAVLNGVNSIK
jgi:excisionase family DNA binding protein